MATHSRILAWRIPIDREAWWGYSPWGCKESDKTEPLHFTSLHFATARWQGSLRTLGESRKDSLPWGRLTDLFKMAERFLEIKIQMIDQRVILLSPLFSTQRQYSPRCCILFLDFQESKHPFECRVPKISKER